MSDTVKTFSDKTIHFCSMWKIYCAYYIQIVTINSRLYCLKCTYCSEVFLIGPCFTWGRISTSCIISTWRNDIKYEIYIYVPSEKIARNGLIFKVWLDSADDGNIQGCLVNMVHIGMVTHRPVGPIWGASRVSYLHWIVGANLSHESTRNWSYNHNKIMMTSFSALLAICAGNSPLPVNSPHKGQWRGALTFSVICVWINGWVNNREADDLRRYRTHHDVTVM